MSKRRHQESSPAIPLQSEAWDYTLSPSTEEEIRRRAYQYYEERGRQDGFAEDDWLRAEAEVLVRHGQNDRREVA